MIKILKIEYDDKDDTFKYTSNMNQAELVGLIELVQRDLVFNFIRHNEEARKSTRKLEDKKENVQTLNK
jgi:hypothetical protein